YHGEQFELARFVRQYRRTRNNESVILGPLDFAAHILVQQQFRSLRQRDVNINKSGGWINPARDQTNGAFHFRRCWVVHREDGDGSPFPRRRKILRFDAQFHRDLVLSNDFHKRTSWRNNLAVLHVDFGDYTRHVRVDVVVAPGASALQRRKLRLRIARRFFRRTQFLIRGKFQIKTLLSLLEFLPSSLHRILGLLKLHLSRRAEFDLDQSIVLLHELTGR